MLPESTLTPGQIAARRRIEREYGKDAPEYWNDNLKMIAGYELIIRDRHETISEEDLHTITKIRNNCMRVLTALGISFDLDALYESEKKRIKSLNK